VKKLYVEVANTPFKRERGLMGRKRIGKNHGMLFDFANSRRLSFWMRNTYVPLDIAFIDEKGIIKEIKEMIPLSTRPVTSSSQCRYALEVNRGWFDNNNITHGASVAGIGIQFNQDNCRTAQIMSQIPQETLPVEPGLDTPIDPQGSAQQESPSPPPDVILDKTHKDLLEDADIKGKDLIIMYVTKDGRSLPPKVISPPFTFEEDSEGEASAIVKAWDNQDASWKSFLIDNIIDLQEKEPPEEKQENLIQEQEL